MTVTVHGVQFEVSDSGKTVKLPAAFLPGVDRIFEGDTGGVVVRLGEDNRVRPADPTERWIFRVVTTSVRPN